MFLKYLFEEIKRLPINFENAECNIDGVEFIDAGWVHLNAGRDSDDIKKIEDLEYDLKEAQEELAKIKKDIESGEAIVEAKKELEEIRENIEREAEIKVKRWETFARECYNSLTPKWKSKMEWRVKDMNKFIEENNKRVTEIPRDKFE